MASVVFNEQNFEEQVEAAKEGILIIDFWSPTCGPCRVFGPIFEKVSEDYADVTFGKLNTAENRNLSAALQIRSIPTVLIMREGITVFRQPGLLREPMLRELLEKVKALDMDEVRAEVARHEAAHANIA